MTTPIATHDHQDVAPAPGIQGGMRCRRQARRRTLRQVAPCACTRPPRRRRPMPPVVGADLRRPRPLRRLGFRPGERPSAAGPAADFWLCDARSSPLDGREARAIEIPRCCRHSVADRPLIGHGAAAWQHSNVYSVRLSRLAPGVPPGTPASRRGGRSRRGASHGDAMYVVPARTHRHAPPAQISGKK